MNPDLVAAWLDSQGYVDYDYARGFLNDHREALEEEEM